MWVSRGKALFCRYEISRAKVKNLKILGGFQKSMSSIQPQVCFLSGVAHLANNYLISIFYFFGSTLLYYSFIMMPTNALYLFQYFVLSF